jgi:hypothetical protein
MAHPSLSILLRQGPDTSATKQHLEELTHQTFLATASADEPASVNFLLRTATPDFVAHPDGSATRPYVGINHAITALAAKKRQRGPWLTRIVSLDADVHDSCTAAVVWLHYYSKGNGQSMPRSMVMRWAWRYVETEGRWMCCRCDWLRGPCMRYGADVVLQCWDLR